MLSKLSYIVAERGNCILVYFIQFYLGRDNCPYLITLHTLPSYKFLKNLNITYGGDLIFLSSSMLQNNKQLVEEVPL
jgi:hypothetical protein